MKRFHLLLVWLTTAWLVSALPLQAAQSFIHSNERITASLVSAEDGVAPDASRISLGLHVDLAEGWKTYWKSPGQVGYPVSFDWNNSQNVLDAEFMWPTPLRFRAFDIENYGYEKSVTFPIELSLEQPGEPATLNAQISMLVCEEICVPEDFELTLELPAGFGVDRLSADLIATAAARLPVPPQNDAGLRIDAAYLDDMSLVVALSDDVSLQDVSIFPNLGPEAAFDEPVMDLSADGKSGVLTLPVLALPEDRSQLELTVANGPSAIVTQPSLSSTMPAAQTSIEQTTSSLAPMLLFAFLGGLILNVMPCVLPVLSIKLTSALSLRDQGLSHVRQGFLASAAGIISFMMVLAFVLIAIRAAGGQIGWGIQFQSPIFLSALLSIMILFAANLAGIFEITLPQSWTTKLDQSGRGPGLWGDFATGALAAVLATPCSAPFLGTAIAFALAGSAFNTVAIFLFLGLGLALPYFLVAARPQLIRALPRPGAWMQWVRYALSLLLVGTAFWLAMILLNVAGPVAVAVIVLISAILAGVFGKMKNTSLKASATLLTALALVLVPTFVSQPPQAAVSGATDSEWQSFEEGQIARLVAEGQTVFVDVTADWCLTCKANKRLVLDRAGTRELLEASDVTLMVADWTRPNPDILAYLNAHGRFGIPFNIAYGPNAPEGIALPEILTENSVAEAIAAAR